MREQGARVAFACGGDGVLCRSMAESQGFDMIAEVRPSANVSPVIAALANGPGFDLVLVDHYDLDAEWERVIAAAGPKIAVIDDLARVHDCAILLDQNLYSGAEQRYDGKVPVGCALLIGPSNALLRPEFMAARDSVAVRGGEIRSLLVSYGGSDPSNETAKAITALLDVTGIERIDVVIGPAMPHAEEFRRLAADDPRFTFHIAPDDMARLMADADLALGAGGSTSWERCVLGLPALVTTVAPNQVESTQALAARGAVLYLGSSECVSADDIKTAIRDLSEDPERVREMGSRSRELMEDACGPSTVAEAMLEVAHARS